MAQLVSELLEGSQGHWFIYVLTFHSQWQYLSQLHSQQSLPKCCYCTGAGALQQQTSVQLLLCSVPVWVGCSSHYASGSVSLFRWLPSSSDFNPCKIRISLQSNALEYFLAIYHTINLSNPLSECSKKALISVLQAWLVIGCWTVKIIFTLIQTILFWLLSMFAYV